MSWGNSISLLKGKIFLIYYIQVRIWHCCQRTQCSCFGWGHTCLNPVLEVTGRARAGLREGARSIAAHGVPCVVLFAEAEFFLGGCLQNEEGYGKRWHEVLKTLRKTVGAVFPPRLLSFLFGFVFVGTYAHSKKFRVQRKAIQWKLFFFSPIFQFPVLSFSLF